MTSKDIPTRIERALRIMKINTDDPAISKRIKENQPSKSVSDLIDRCKIALSTDEKLSEDGMELLTKTLQLIYVYGVAVGEKEGFKQYIKSQEQQKSPLPARNQPQRTKPSLIVKLFGRKAEDK